MCPLCLFHDSYPALQFFMCILYLSLLHWKLQEAVIVSCIHEQIPTRYLVPCFAHSGFSLKSPNAIMQQLSMSPYCGPGRPCGRSEERPGPCPHGASSLVREIGIHKTSHKHSVTHCDNCQEDGTGSRRGAYFRLRGGMRLL